MLTKPLIWKLVNTFFFTFCVIFCVHCSEKETIVKKEQVSKSTTIITDTLNSQNHANLVANTTDTEDDLLLFIGTYSTSVYVYKMDTITGAITQLSISPNTASPSYLAVHPNNKWVYVANETASGTISAFSFDTLTTKLNFINSVSAKGNAPCYISLDQTGKYIMVANYNSGNVTVCPINSDGSLSEACSTDQHSGKGTVAGRQDGPHAHMIAQAANKFIYNTDLGINKIIIYKLDTSSGKLENAGVDATAETGAGPRHIAFHPNQKWAYVVGELGGIVEAFTLNNAIGSLTHFQSISTLQAGVTAAAASADIHITPNGKFLYASNRGSNNNIAMYSIDPVSGKLTLIGHQKTLGNTPRNFAIDPSGTFLLAANQDGNNVVTFKINQTTGVLEDSGLKSTIPSPVCIKFARIHIAKPASTGIKTIKN